MGKYLTINKVIAKSEELDNDIVSASVSLRLLCQDWRDLLLDECDKWKRVAELAEDEKHAAINELAKLRAENDMLRLSLEKQDSIIMPYYDGKEVSIDARGNDTISPELVAYYEQVAKDEYPDSHTPVIRCQRCGDPIRVGVCENCLPDIEQVSDTMPMREAVFWFAGEMEKKLHEHDYDRGRLGWLCNDCDPAYLMERLLDEAEELKNTPDDKLYEQIKEAADIANFAMMLADRARAALERGLREDSHITPDMRVIAPDEYPEPGMDEP